MNFNDLKRRLEKTFASIGNMFDSNVVEGTKITDRNIGNHHKLSVTFGKDNIPTLENKIFLILHNLSSIKDHLKNCLAKKGISPKIVETEIDNSLHLQVLIDLVNQEKHGYPLTKTNRSGKNPIIKDISQALTFRKNQKDGSSSSFSFSFDSDCAISSDDNSTIAIVADIFDDKNNKLFDLDELVETCYSKFENIAIENGCI